MAKKKITVKTVRARKPQLAEAAPEGAAVPQQAAAPVAVMPTVKPASYTLAAILALIATACFIALLVLQYMEFAYYHAPMSAFVRPIPTALP